MYIMAIVTWPSKYSVDVGKATVEALKNPPANAKRAGPYTVYGGDGVKSYSLWEVEKGHEEEGYKEIVKNYVPYLSIEGFKTSLEWVLTAEDSLPMIGLGT